METPNPALVNLAHFESISEHTRNVAYDIENVFPTEYDDGTPFAPLIQRFGIFGSVAQGTFHEKSDLDLVVFGDDDWVMNLFEANVEMATCKKFKYIEDADRPQALVDKKAKIKLPMLKDNVSRFRDNWLDLTLLADRSTGYSFSPLREYLALTRYEHVYYQKPVDWKMTGNFKEIRRTLMGSLLNTEIPEWMDVLILPLSWRQARYKQWITQMYDVAKDTHFSEVLFNQILEFDRIENFEIPPRPSRSSGLTKNLGTYF